MYRINFKLQKEDKIQKLNLLHIYFKYDLIMP